MIKRIIKFIRGLFSGGCGGNCNQGRCPCDCRKS